MLRAPGLDGEGEFSKRGCNPMPGLDIDREFVVAAAQVWTKAWPVLITRSESSLLSPRIGRSRDFNRPWSASMMLFAYCSVTWCAAGSNSSSSRG